MLQQPDCKWMPCRYHHEVDCNSLITTSKEIINTSGLVVLTIYLNENNYPCILV
ncbi:hypothetical protein [uncultured Methanobrevibacter sp.]|uniref:hypothetical protein n=1 Tax=uncultured Methanobrevibacter sp. TaxID=253161 RepID=UPI0025F2A2AF|nr:hypothetical protein [uncultured Methanobrevibacter sp.]